MREKFQLEFILNVSTGMLYNYISSPSGLSEWFADDVNVRGEKYIFVWDGDEETAFLVRNKQDHYLRFRWEQDQDTEYYFELLIDIDELTGDVSLTVTDFSDPDEIEQSKMWWENQIRRLRKVIGS